MRARATAFTIAALWIGQAPVAAAQSRVQTGAEFGFAFPALNLERGSRTSDVTYGLGEFGVDVAYEFDRSWAAGLAFRYGVGVPTLCTTSSDCVSSLGHDTEFGVLGRWHPLIWRSIEPSFDLELGYEWFGARLTERDAKSSRSYRGWDASIRCFGAVRISRRFVMGPLLGLSGGFFQRMTLRAPGLSSSRETDGAFLHLWPLIGIRAAAVW